MTSNGTGWRCGGKERRAGVALNIYALMILNINALMTLNFKALMTPTEQGGGAPRGRFAAV